MKCNYCGSENQEGAKFCSECGSKFEEVFDTKVVGENNNKKCRICGTDNDPDASYCVLCGSQLKDNNTSNNNYYSNNNYNDQEIYSNEDPNAKLATVSMVLGIIAIISSFTCCLFIIGLVLGVISIVLSSIYLVRSSGSKYPKGKAIAGLVCSIIAVLFALYLTFEIVVVLNSEEYQEYIKQMIDEIYGNGNNTPENGEGFRMFFNMLKK